MGVGVATGGSGVCEGIVTGAGVGVGIVGGVTGAVIGGIGSATDSGLVFGITRGGSGVVDGNNGGAADGVFGVAPLDTVVPCNPPGGVGKTGGGEAELGFATGMFADEGMRVALDALGTFGVFGVFGFFEPKIRLSTPGFFPESVGISGFIEELVLDDLSLSRSPKIRLRRGRRSFSFGGSGMVADSGGRSGSFVRCFALGKSGVLGDAGLVSSVRVRKVNV